LRARAEDIPELARHFLDRAAAEGLPRKSLDPSAIAWARAQPWPGNVRELQNAMRRLAALARDDVITAAACELHIGGFPDSDGAVSPGPHAANMADQSLAGVIGAWLDRSVQPDGPIPEDGLYDRLLAEFERPLLARAMQLSSGNQLRAAKLLGVNRNTLRKMLRMRGLDPRGP
jgi:two-component system nitrogen regulation response regulator GlnG